MELIDAGEIAKEIRRSRRHVLERVVRQKGFPLPIVPGRPSLWDKAEVLNFFIRNRNRSDHKKAA